MKKKNKAQSRKAKKAKRPLKRTTAKSPKKTAVKKLKAAGMVTHYFNAIRVAIIKCNQPLSIGTTLGFRGATTNFDEKISSMQFDHKPILRSRKGQEIGIKVKKRVREDDQVFLIA